MYFKLTAALSGILFVTAFGGNVLAADIGQLLNQANAMNYDEIHAAKTAKAKAGDNQSLTTYAETLKGDHEANQEAVKALSSQKNVKLESISSDVDHKVEALDKLDGGAFNTAFLKDEVTDHEKALSSFRSARSKFKDDPDVELYIDETIPILRAHLEMAKNLESQVGTNANENPANNKKQ
jgi:putative membrane protein